MAKVVSDPWVSRVVDTTLAEFLRDPGNWPGEAAQLEPTALAALTTKLRAQLTKSSSVINEARRARLRYCNTAYKQLRAFKQAGVFAFLSVEPKALAIAEGLAGKQPTDLTPDELVIAAPRFSNILRLLEKLREDNGVVLGGAQAQRSKQQQKKKQARKATVQKAQDSVSWLQMIGSRVLRYEEALAAKEPESYNTARLLFNELYGSLRGWLVANETGGALDQIDGSSPVELQAFKRGYTQQGGWIVADSMCAPPVELLRYDPSWDRTDPDAVAFWLWRQNGRVLTIDMFLAAYADDTLGMEALEHLLGDEANEGKWALAGAAFDALVRMSDYQTGAIYKRMLRAEECLAKLQQGARTVETEIAQQEPYKSSPRPWTMQVASQVEALYLTELDKQFPYYDLRVRAGARQIEGLRTLESGTRYGATGIVDTASARDPWVSSEMLSQFVNDRLQVWFPTDFSPLWDDAGPNFLQRIRNVSEAREVREDGTIMGPPGSRSPFVPWKLQVIEDEGFYRYRTWNGGITRVVSGVTTIADLLEFKLPSESQDGFLNILEQVNKNVRWEENDEGVWSWEPGRNSGANPIQDMRDGNDPYIQLKGSGFGDFDLAEYLIVPRFIPYAVLSTAGDASTGVGYKSYFTNVFNAPFSTAISTRSRYFLGYLNNDYSVFDPSDRTSFSTLERMFKRAGTGAARANDRFRSRGGLYSVAWPAALTWVSLTDSPPTPSDAQAALADPVNSPYDGGLTNLQETRIRRLAGQRAIGEILEPEVDSQSNEIVKGNYSLGLLWRMTRGAKDNTDRFRFARGGSATRNMRRSLKGSMLELEEGGNIPLPTPGLRDMGRKLKKQRKLERIGLYSSLFDTSFKLFVREQKGGPEDLAARYNANWVGYRPRAYSAKKEFGTPSITPHLVRWKHQKGIHLYDYQSDAVLRLDGQQGGLLAFDVGVGKTLTALAAVAYARQEGKARRVMAIVPNTIQRQWLQEFKAALPDYNVVILGQTLRSPTKVPKGGPAQQLFRELANKGQQKGSAGGWLWRAVRDYNLPGFKKAGIKWASKKDGEGWRGITADAQALAQTLVLQGGTLKDLAPHLLPHLTKEEAARVFTGLPRAFQKATREERDQRWQEFAAGQYDAMVCSEVDFSNLAMREETLRNHLEKSPALRSVLINDSFSSSGSGSELKRRLQRAKKAQREYNKLIDPAEIVLPADVRNWELDVVFPPSPSGVMATPVATLPPDLGVPKSPAQTVGQALDDFVEQALADIETLSGDYWEEAISQFSTRWFGPNRNTPDEPAQLAYLDMLNEPYAYGIQDAQGHWVTTIGEPAGFTFWSKHKIGKPRHRLVDGKGPADWRSIPLRDDARAADGSRLVAYQSIAGIPSFAYPDGIASGSKSFALIDYAPGGNGVPVRYSLVGSGWRGKPLGVVTAKQVTQGIADLLNAEWSQAKTVPGGFDGLDPSNQTIGESLKGPFVVAPLPRGKAKTAKALRPAQLSTQDRRSKLAQRMSMLPKPYDTQDSWDTPPKVYWEDLQCDCLIVDEAHKFKALFSPRERGGKVAYLQSGQSSKRAWAMEVRCSDVKGRNGRVMLLTATPAKTSPLEFYNVMQLVGAPGLGGDLSVFSQFSIYTPEQFVSRFVKIEDTIIIDPDGSMRRGAAATAFINLDKEFTAIFHRYANRKTVLDVPALRGKRAGKGKGAVYKGGEVEVILPDADLSGVSIGDRFQLETGNSKGGYRIQGFLGNGNGATGVALLPPPAKDSSNDAILAGDNWSVFTEGRVPLGPPPAVVDVPLDHFQGVYYGALQRALARMILESRRRAVVSIGGQDLLSTTKLKVYPAMSRLTLHPQLELYTFDVEIYDTEGVEAGVKTKREIGNPFAHGLALAMDPLVDPVETLVSLYRQGFGPWSFFGAPAPTKSGNMAQKGGLSSTIKVVNPAYNTVISEAFVLQSKLQAGDVLTSTEEKRLAAIEAEFDPDKKESARKDWARAFVDVSALKYIGTTARTREGRLKSPGGITNTVNGVLEPKDTINPMSSRLAALIDRVLSRSLEDERTAANVTCGNIAFCGNLYMHAWTVVAWCRMYAVTKLFQEWAAKHVAKGFNPDAGVWVRRMEDYGLNHLWYTPAAVLRIALPEADFTVTPTSVVANNTHPETELAVEIMERGFPAAEGYEGEAASYRKAGEDVELFSLFQDEDPDTQPLKDSFDGYYVEGANKIVTMNAKTAPTVVRQDVTDAFNGEYSTGENGETTVVVPRTYILAVANEVAYEGVDMQAATCAIHHLDLPWTPSDFIQRQGRGVRQGNAFEVVDSYVYLSRNTVDYFRLQALERKRAWLESALDAESPTFELAANEEELLQLACQSVHPDDVVAVCAQAAKKLAEIKREQMVKEFVPIKANIREVARAANLAFRWNATEAKPFYAVNQYKSFLQASKVLRETNTGDLLQPAILEPSITEVLQLAFLQGADPDDIPGSLNRLLPVGVCVSRAIEDPTSVTPDPVLVEGQFLTGVVGYRPKGMPQGYGLDAGSVPPVNPLLNLPGSQPVVLRQDAFIEQRLQQGSPEEQSMCALPFGGVYIGKPVVIGQAVRLPAIEAQSAEAVWGLVVAPNTGRYTIDNARPAMWQPMALSADGPRGFVSVYRQVGKTHAALGQDFGRESYRSPDEWVRNTAKAALQSYDLSPGDMREGAENLFSEARFKEGGRDEDSSRTLEVQIPYSPEYLEALMDMETLQRANGSIPLSDRVAFQQQPAENNTYRVDELFFATILNLVPRFLPPGPYTPLYPGGEDWYPYSYRGYNRWRPNSLCWLSGVPEEWINYYWNHSTPVFGEAGGNFGSRNRSNLQGLICFYMLTRYFSVSSVGVWLDKIEQLAKIAARDYEAADTSSDPEGDGGWMEALSGAMTQLVPYGTEPLQQTGVLELSEAELVLRSEDYQLFLPVMVGTKPFVVTPKKLGNMSDLLMLLLCGPVLARAFAEVAPQLDAANLQGKLSDAQTARDAASAALKKVPDDKPEERDALSREIGEQQTRVDRFESVLLLLGGQAVSIAPPTYEGMTAWNAAVSTATGQSQPGLSIGVVGGREWDQTQQQYFGQLLSREGVPAVSSTGGGVRGRYVTIFGSDSPWVKSYLSTQEAAPSAWKGVQGGTQQRLFKPGNDDDEE